MLQSRCLRVARLGTTSGTGLAEKAGPFPEAQARGDVVLAVQRRARQLA